MQRLMLGLLYQKEGIKPQIWEMINTDKKKLKLSIIFKS